MCTGCSVSHTRLTWPPDVFEAAGESGFFFFFYFFLFRDHVKILSFPRTTNASGFAILLWWISRVPSVSEERRYRGGFPPPPLVTGARYLFLAYERTVFRDKFFENFRKFPEKQKKKVSSKTSRIGTTSPPSEHDRSDRMWCLHELQ